MPITAVQNPYNLSDRGHDDVVDHCAREGIVFVPFFPLRGSGGRPLAEIARRAFGYTRIEGLTMWSLSITQVAATLAAALVAYNTTDPAGERLIGESVLNSVIVLLVVTSVLGPILTEAFAKRLPTPTVASVPDEESAEAVVVPAGEHHALV